MRSLKTTQEAFERTEKALTDFGTAVRLSAIRDATRTQHSRRRVLRWTGVLILGLGIGWLFARAWTLEMVGR